MSNGSILPIGAITLGQGGPGNDGNEGIILQSSSITGTSPSDC